MLKNPFSATGLEALRQALFQTHQPPPIIGEPGRSWTENPRLLAAHQKKRKSKLKTKRAMRRQRGQRGQNRRTGKAA